MKRFLVGLAKVLAALILLLLLAIALLLGWLKWSGDRDWKQAEAELRAKGEKLTFAELVPPMPPENENFFADPLWTGYSDLVRKKLPHEGEELAPRLPKDQQPLYKTHTEEGRTCVTMDGGCDGMRNGTTTKQTG
jgi:hypothetical protein